MVNKDDSFAHTNSCMLGGVLIYIMLISDAFAHLLNMYNCMQAPIFTGTFLLSQTHLIDIRQFSESCFKSHICILFSN